MNLAGKCPDAFKTARLLVRRNRLEDEEQLFDAARESISQVYPFLPWCHPNYQREDAQYWLLHCNREWQKGSAHTFGIYKLMEPSTDPSTKPSTDPSKAQRLIGGCGLNRIDDHPVANLGYWIRSSELGKGYATEATVGLIQFGFQQLHLARIEIIMSIQNAASERVARKSGANFEGRLKQRLKLHGKLHDAWLFAACRDDEISN